MEGSDLSTSEDRFEPTAGCINDTMKRQLVTRSALSRLRCCVCHLHHKWAMNAPAVVREFFGTVLQQVCHLKVDVIAGNTNAVDLCCLAQPMQTPPEGLDWQWRHKTLPPLLHACPCSPLRMPMIMTNTKCGILCWDFFYHVHVGAFMEAFFYEVDLGRIAFSCDCLWMCWVTKRRFIAPMHAPFGTIALVRASAGSLS